MKPFNEHDTKAWDDKTKQNLHGDVILERIESLPKEFDSLKDEPQQALAYGEATGHIHKLFRMPDREGSELPTFKLKITENGERYLKVLEPTILKHQEHSPRVIQPGNYKIGIQREYDPYSKIVRRVID